MTEIIPAIIAKNFEELKQKIAVIESIAPWAQIDVMDGIFTPPTTVNEPATLNELDTRVRCEAHLMVAHPENVIDAWLDSPIERILVHYEATAPAVLHDIIVRGAAKRKDVGIALTYETPVSVLDEFFTQHPSFRSVQLMSIAEIGYHGHPFEEKTIEKISVLQARHPDGIIAVDGGVNSENIPRIVRAGARRIIAGSAIFSAEDPKAVYAALVRIAKDAEI